MKSRLLTLLLWAVLTATVHAQIPHPDDAPKPLTPAESAKRFKLPDGFRMELIASEPLIHEPTGVCWDERGRFFVCELHGYNLEGQYDIEELNKTGKLDLQVRRIQADEKAKQAAKAGTYGTVKLLRDTNGDGRMDEAVVWADHLPPCYGLVPARGGLIVACAPDIVFLSNPSGDERTIVREVLFTGLAAGSLERGVNNPQWGPDNWIYFGRGHGGGTITGPHLKEPVKLAHTDFRIKADGSAIEPISGSTKTIGFTFTEAGDRFVTSTSVPGEFVTPLPWRYLARNPDAVAPAMDQIAGDYTRVYPAAPPHPWRTKREQNAEYFEFYKRISLSDAAASGYFTSACGPLVYQDTALPGLNGQYLVCEPAQNFVHRAVIEPAGPMLHLKRQSENEKLEFLDSADPWFHAIALSHAPDGTICVVDFYREIIEDYSAIPRHLQQQYGLMHGSDRGRIWKLTYRGAPKATDINLAALSAEALAREAISPSYWHRQTARRMLAERAPDKSAITLLMREVHEAKSSVAVINALYTLEALNALPSAELLVALAHPAPAVRVHALQLAESQFAAHGEVLEAALKLAGDPEPRVLLQVALSLGESTDARVTPALVRLAREHGNIRWMPNAIISALPARGGEMLALLLDSPRQIGQGTALLEPLCAAIGARSDAPELNRAFAKIASLTDASLQGACLRGLRQSLKNPRHLALSDDARAALTALTAHPDLQVRTLSEALVTSLKLEDPAKHAARVAQAMSQVGDVKLPVETRLAAVATLSVEDKSEATAALLAAWPANTPKVQEAILAAVFLTNSRLRALLDTLEKQVIPASALTAVQREMLLRQEGIRLRERAEELFKKLGGPSDEMLQRFNAALKGPRNLAHGEQVFRDNCATCHHIRGLGFAVGPDLGAEFQRAEDAILKDILAPNATISAGYPTSAIETVAGQSFSGILSSESATSVTLRMPAGAEQVILRKDIAKLSTLSVSLMPEALAQTLAPQDVADVIAWLRKPTP